MIVVMTSLETRLSNMLTWCGNNGLMIVLIVVGAMLLTRFTTWFKTMITERIDANDAESDELVRSEAAKHRHALAQVLSWTALVIVYCASGVQIATRLGIL